MAQALQVWGRWRAPGTAVLQSEKLLSGDCAAVGVVAAKHHVLTLAVSLRLSGCQKANSGLT